MLELQRLLALPLLSQLFDEQRRGGGAYATIGQAARRKGMALMGLCGARSGVESGWVVMNTSRHGAPNVTE